MTLISGGTPEPPGAAIVASGLFKRFGDVAALDGIDFFVPAGTVFGLLGPNGAGKTTTVRILTTIIRPDAGEARVLGHDVVTEATAVRSSIGLAGQYAAVDENLTGSENLRLVGKLTHLPRSLIRERSAELLERFELTDAANRPVRTYSGGMRRRLDLAASLVHRPAVLFLDEPTTGLDPRHRNEVWDAVRALVADGVTVLLTTQYLEEADQLADQVAVLDQGRLVAQGTPDELKRLIPGTHVRLRFANVSQLDAAAVLFPEATRDDDALALRVPSDAGTTSLRAMLDRLDEYALTADEFSVHTPDLDDVFLALTGHTTEATR